MAKRKLKHALYIRLTHADNCPSTWNYKTLQQCLLWFLWTSDSLIVYIKSNFTKTVDTNWLIAPTIFFKFFVISHFLMSKLLNSNNLFSSTLGYLSLCYWNTTVKTHSHTAGTYCTYSHSAALRGFESLWCWQRKSVSNFFCVNADIKNGFKWNRQTNVAGLLILCNNV